MDDLAERHLWDLYGLNPSMLPPQFDFPRLNPGMAHPMFKNHENPAKEQFLRQSETMLQKLEGFQKMYQQYASGLLAMNSAVIPPEHPLYARENSLKMLQNENDKLLKENMELKKKLEKESDSK